ncbi:MAG: hypothetical protein DRI32_04640 [Chloroflexi bacterium]|nr:MAG: hypothetical protein DRI32_04640 [Chloroflexota bacterium]
MSLLDLPFLLETRRNHALEHATLKILSPKYPAVPMGGHSNPTGYFIIGDVHPDDLRAAAEEALERLRAGESSLAIHPGCGTNYATSGLLAGSVAWFGLKGKSAWYKKVWRIPFILPLAVLVWELSKPLGPLMQAKVTTEAKVGAMEIVSVEKIRPSLHRVITR